MNARHFKFVNELFNAFTYIYFRHYMEEQLNLKLVECYPLGELRQFTNQFASFKPDFKQNKINEYVTYLKALRDDEETRKQFILEKRYSSGNNFSAEDIALSVRYFQERLQTDGKMFMEELFFNHWLNEEFLDNLPQKNLNINHLIRLLYLSDNHIHENNIIFKLNYQETAKDLKIDLNTLKDNINKIILEINHPQLIHDASNATITLSDVYDKIVVPDQYYNVTQVIPYCLGMLKCNLEEYVRTCQANTFPIYQQDKSMTFFHPQTKPSVGAEPFNANDPYDTYFESLFLAKSKCRLVLFQKTLRECGLPLFDLVYIPTPGLDKKDVKETFERRISEYLQDKYHIPRKQRQGHITISKACPEIVVVPNYLSAFMSGIILLIGWVPTKHEEQAIGLDEQEFIKFLEKILQTRLKSKSLDTKQRVPCYGTFVKDKLDDGKGSSRTFDLRGVQQMAMDIPHIRGSDSMRPPRDFKLFSGCGNDPGCIEGVAEIEIDGGKPQVEIFQIQVLRKGEL